MGSTQTCGSGGSYIIGGVIADVQNLVRRDARQFHDTFEELPGWLRDTPLTRSRHCIHRQPQCTQPLGHFGRLVPGHDYSGTCLAQRGESRTYIWVEVSLAQRFTLACGLHRGALSRNVDTRANHPYRVGVVPALSDDRADQGRERMARHTEPIGPSCPSSIVAYQRLADIERHHPNRTASRLGHASVPHWSTRTRRDTRHRRVGASGGVGSAPARVGTGWGVSDISGSPRVHPRTREDQLLTYATSA